MPTKRTLAIAPTAKPAKAGKPVVAKPAKSAVPAAPVAAKPSANITRTAATVARQATHFGDLTDRDNAYFGFYKRLIAANGGKLTIAAIHGSGSRPTPLPGTSFSSDKPHDAGVIVRLGKAGLIAGLGTDASPIALTKLGTSHK